MSRQHSNRSWVPHWHWLLLVAFVAFISVIYLSLLLPYHVQQQAINEIERLGGHVDHEPGGPGWLRDLIGDEWMEVFDVVTDVSFSGSSVKNEDLVILQCFPDVISLSLNSTQISDAGIRHVVLLTKLERLDLYRTQIGNESLKAIKKLPHLTSLPMGETNVTDEGLVHVGEMTQLEYLGLRGNNITDEGLVHLEPLHNLSGLFLGETRVTDAGLSHLHHMEKMDHLRLFSVNVTDAGLIHLKGMTRMSRLDIYDTGITDDGVGQLKSWFPYCQIVDTEEKTHD